MSRQSPIALEPSTSAERRSCVVFTTILLLVLMAVAFPAMAPQALLGIMWAGVGLLMLLLPPEVRLPRAWSWLALGFVAFSLVGFMPRSWFHVAAWRLALEALGLNTGTQAFVQPRLAAEAVTGFAVTAALVVFLLGHRVGTRLHQRLALGFVLGVAAWTAAALYGQQPDALFGFFPNRNHTATLLAMATFVGLGSCAQAIRQTEPWKIALSVVPTCIFLWVLFTVSESRAGIVLAAAGFMAWFLLAGLRYLRGHAGKAAALILLAMGGMFFIADSKVKSRLDHTVELITSQPGPAGAAKISFDEGAAAPLDLNMDGRLSIYQDTWSMIRRELWTGVGPGQFAQVFPQYRAKTTAPNDSRCLHPESDWLLMLAETGWPATLCLVGGLMAVFFMALTRAWHSRARLLRMGCLVAALLLCLHGGFDVPGHRVGLAWAAALLVAMSLRPAVETADAPNPVPSRAARVGWRGLGLALLLGGAGLLHAQWTNAPVLPSVQALSLVAQAKAFYDADQAAYEQAAAAGRDYQPPPGQDLLEDALERVGQALDIAPLDPHLHFTRGALALHFDDKPGAAIQAFAIQRQLAPTLVKLPLEQARAWMIQDPRQTRALWAEALRRAAAEDARHPQSLQCRTNTYQAVLQAAGNDESLAAAALESAGGDPALRLIWARYAPASVLDREMPGLLAAPVGVNARLALFQVWQSRGSKAAATGFARAHPELELAPP